MLGLALATLCAQAVGDDGAPRFERVVLDAKVGIGYGVALGDVDGDGRDDVVLVDQHELRAYVAPKWERRVVVGPLTAKDLVCVAARAVDAAPGCELALGGQWDPGDTTGSGAVFTLLPPADRARSAKPWSARELPHEPTVHRMKWILDRADRASLIVAPLHGRGNVDGRGEPVRLLEYLPPLKNDAAAGRADWSTRPIDASLHLVHGFSVVEWDGDADEELLVAAREGVFLFDRDVRGEAWTKTELIGPHAGAPDFAGAGEVRAGRFANGRRYLATIEPMHGSRLVAWIEPSVAGGRWTPLLLDDSLSEGHALGTGDLLARGDDQVVAGWRRPDAQGKTGLRFYAPISDDPPRFTRRDLDDRIACEDLTLGDLDGDGRLDLVASGRDSHDLVLFLNRTKAPDVRGRAAPSAAPLDLGWLARIDGAVEEALAQKKLPGCVVAVGRHDGVKFLKAYGDRALVPERAPMTTDTVFDLASLTKPIATATGLALLVERGKLRLEDPLTNWLPEFAPAEPAARNGDPALERKRKVTLRDALLHVAGFVPDNDLADYAGTQEQMWARLFSQAPTTEPGSQFAYSDVGYELLGKVVERASGEGLAEFARARLFAPLRMRETGFLPGPELRARAAPTEPRDGVLLQGEVHDPRAAKLGGVAGHAGLFSTARDLSRYARMILNDGELDGVRVLSPRTVALLATAEPVAGGEGGRAQWRTPGFDARSRFSSNRGELMTARAFGHGGFTGTSLWIDPGLDLFVVFLSNRVHPDGKGVVNPLIGRIGSIAAAAVGRATSGADAGDLAPPPASTDARSAVKTGIDVLRAAGFAPLAGRRVGLVTNATGRAADGTPTLELLAGAPDLKLVALYSPEHGLGGRDEGAIADGVEPKSGLPIRSLYSGSSAGRATPAAFADVDTLVVDLQDAGARCYTYVGTLVRVLEAVAGTKVRVVVLDRPNPVGGLAVEGPLPDPGELSLTCWHPVAFRHGMTIGELAEMVRAERPLDVDLQVIAMEGWRRSQLFDETGLRWVDPSPNLRGVEATLLYSGLVLFEPTNLSVGRGTERPFEQIGAPWLDGRALAAALAKADLPGATAMPVEFTPTASLFADQRCGGVRFQITDRSRLEPMRVALSVAVALHEIAPTAWLDAKMDGLLRSKATLDALHEGKSAEEIARLWERDVEEFRRRRAPFLRY
jgi:uncharacterized protein YbbC (DUF1343 family)/CubicO group peptidase (beta-lactamase class C family)